MATGEDRPRLSDPVTIKTSEIPSGDNVDIRNSSYFQRYDKLPTTDEVRSRAIARYSQENPDKPLPMSFFGKAPSVQFEDLNVFVKWGTKALVAEAQCLFAVHHHFGAAVPVPEVYGWRKEGDIVYIFMELVPGPTLESVWDSLEDDSRESVALQLQTIFANLRLGKQEDQPPFIGNIKKGPICDRAIGEHFTSQGGPFDSVREFHEWFSFLPRRPMDDPYSVPVEPFRSDLSDESEIKLTNGDLHRRNVIMARRKSPPRVAAIVDWEQSGWLPAYWEVRKAFWTSWHRSEWTTQYLPRILSTYEKTAQPWDYYVSSLGN